MGNLHQYVHETYGFCLWNLLTIVLAVLLVVWLVVHVVRQKKRQHDYQDELSQKTQNLNVTKNL